MKITDIKIDVVKRKLPDTGLSSDLGRFFGEVEQGVLRILTDEGIEGNCFVGEFRNGAESLYKPILKVLKTELIGRDPSEREFLWNRLRLLTSRRGMNMSAWAPVDVALWDIQGKAAKMPVFKLLGTQRYEIEPYATYPPRHTSYKGYVEEAKEIVTDGFKAYKIHPGAMNTTDTIQMVNKVREAVGDEVELMLDPNCGYDFRKAFDIGKELDANGFYWFEDPVPFYDLDAITELSSRLDVPLCMSDQADNQFFNGATILRRQSNRLLRGTAAKLGITGLKKLCSMAEGFGYNCEIGTAGNSLLNIANLHVIFSVTNCAYFEWWQPTEAHRFGLIEDISRNEKGMIEAPTKPGLGYELDWDFLNAHKIRTLE